MDDPDINSYSDDESLAGLTQVPSQINLEKEHDEDESDEFSDTGLDELFSDENVVCRKDSVFALIPAVNLANCSQNNTVNFDTEVFAIGMDSQVSQDEDVDHHGESDVLQETRESISAMGNDKEVVAYSSTPNVHCSQVASTSGVQTDTGNKPAYVVDTSDISDDEVVSCTEALPAKEARNTLDLHDTFQTTSKKRGCDKVRFKQPRSAADMQELAKLQVKRATKSKIDWAVRAYERWRNYRRKVHHTSKLPPSRDNRLIRPMSESIKDIDEIQQDVCDFISEVKKETGDEYPPCSLYDLVFMLSLFAEREYNSKRFITDQYPRIKNTLDGLMKERTEMGLGLVRSKDVVTEEHEEMLWQKGILGELDPDQLRRTVMYLIGVKFGLRGGAEHRSLRRYPFCQLNFEEQEGKDCLVYRERHSKMHQGGIKNRNVRQPKVAYTFCSGYRPHCLLQLFEKYQFYCPRPSFHLTAFYLQTNPNWQNEDFWYLRRAVGKNTLANYVKDMMRDARIVGNFSNHSLRGTTASRLYQKNVDEQLICEQMGHRSTAVHRYKQTNFALKEKVSDLLNVLPPGVEKCVSTAKRKASFVPEIGSEVAPKKQVLSDQSSSNVQSVQKVPFQEEEVVKISKANSKCVVKNSNKVDNAVKVTEHENSEPPKVQSSDSCPGGVVVVQNNVQDPIDVHVPVPDVRSMQGMVNIHFHFGNK